MQQEQQQQGARTVAVPRLAMFGKFERWVISGRKTATIRYKRQIPADVTQQEMALPGGTPVLVECGLIPIYWPQQPHIRKVQIANAEGFDSVEAFEHELANLKLYGRPWLMDFLTGKRPAFYHKITLLPATAGEPEAA